MYNSLFNSLFAQCIIAYLIVYLLSVCLTQCIIAYLIVYLLSGWGRLMWCVIAWRKCGVLYTRTPGVRRNVWISFVFFFSFKTLWIVCLERNPTVRWNVWLNCVFCFGKNVVDYMCNPAFENLPLYVISLFVFQLLKVISSLMIC